MISALAERYTGTKFVSIQSTECIPNWKDSNVPCLFLYHDGSLQTQLIGMEHCGGKYGSTVDKLDWSLASKGVFKSKCESNPFEKKFEIRRNFVVQHEEHVEKDSDDEW